MHGDVATGVMQKIDFKPTTYIIGEKPKDPSIGETHPDNPIGDAVLPLLLIACAYVLVRMFRNRKKLQSVNN
jgi:hypothetical protein